jgi:hypothetical protein
MISALHPNQLKILAAIRQALQTLGMTDHLAIVGSLAKYLDSSGTTKVPGDVDVFIDRSLCKCYWEFLEILASRGIKSLWDVPDRSSLPWWNSWCPRVQHGLAFWIEPPSPALHNKLDIVLNESDLQHIPRSGQWIIFHDQTKTRAQTAREQDDGRKELLRQLRDAQRPLSSAVFSDELGLNYRLVI